MRGWGNNMGADDLLDAQAIISMTVARVQPRDDAWYILASNALGVTEAVLRTYAAHGDSLSLAILIHVVRQYFSNFGKMFQRYDFSFVLKAASRFDVQDTSPELQHEFCALWNQIVRHVQNNNSLSMAFFTLGRIRAVYLALHQDTECAPTRFSPSTSDWDGILRDPSSYPVCNLPAHHLNLSPHIHDENSTSTAFVLAVPSDQDNTTLVLSSLASPNPLSLSINVPHRVDDSLTDAPLPLRSDISFPASLQSVDQETTESPRIAAISPNPVTTGATNRSTDTSPRTMHLSTPESLAFTPLPKSQTTLSDDVAIEHTISCTPSGDLDVWSPPATPFLVDMLPRGPLLSLNSSASRSNFIRQNLICRRLLKLLLVCLIHGCLHIPIQLLSLRERGMRRLFYARK